MKNFLKIAGIIILVAGAVLGTFTTIPLAEYIAIFGEALGLVLTIVSTLSKVEKKTWKEIVAIICFVIAAVALGFTGVSKEIGVQIITAVAGLVALIIGIITASKSSK